MNNNENSNVVRIDAWQRDKQLKEQQRQIDAQQPIVIPEYIAVAAEDSRALTERMGFHAVKEVVDKVREAAADDDTSTGPGFFYDK